MLEKKEFPILEFDPNPAAKIKPSAYIARQDVPKTCVISFFGDVIQQKLEQGLLHQLAIHHTSFQRLPVYKATVQNKCVGLVQGFFGAAGAARQLEDLIAMGFEQFIVCGGAGVLQKDIQVGYLVLPNAAVRDEGVSYHYVAPAREIACDPYALAVMEGKLKSEGVPYICGKTWTTDAPYRETDEKIALRAAEGCVTVEMETAAFFAVAQFRQVPLGVVLYGGDDVSGTAHDSRRWNKGGNRTQLVDLCLETVLLL